MLSIVSECFSLIGSLRLLFIPGQKLVLNCARKETESHRELEPWQGAASSELLINLRGQAGV